MPLAQWTILAAALLGWSDTITIQPSRGDRSSGLQRSVASIDRPSDRTQETLRRFDLDKEYRHDVNSALQHLEKFAQRRAEPELVYALAELSWIEGKRLDRWRKPQAIDRFLDAAAYAHDYLFGTEPGLVDGRGRSDPRFRLACEIYNAGVERLIPPCPDQGTGSSPRTAKRSRSRCTAASSRCGSSSRSRRGTGLMFTRSCSRRISR